jgi:protein-S-isoprenylcysteine O-methyltransferase Ste14
VILRRLFSVLIGVAFAGRIAWLGFAWDRDMQIWPIVLTVSGLTVSGQFAYAIRRHFVSEKLPLGMKLLAALSYLAILAYLYALWTSGARPWERLAGLVLQGVASLLFNWARRATQDSRLTAAFDTDEPRFLLTAGPYRFVRHPFYASYIVFWVGSSVAANSWILWLLCGGLVAAYVIAARLEERKFQDSRLSDDYRGYRETTGFLIPNLAQTPKRQSLDDRSRLKP